MCTGSFRLAAGNRHLHRYYKFAESLVKTVARSLRHSCRSELTRQGISLTSVTPQHIVVGTGHFCRFLHVAMQVGLYLHPTFVGVWHIVSEDSSGLCIRWPFLLIICTQALSPNCFGSLRYSDFPANSQILLRLA